MRRRVVRDYGKKGSSQYTLEGKFRGRGRTPGNECRRGRVDTGDSEEERDVAGGNGGGRVKDCLGRKESVSKEEKG
jgi:hypothetical protein